MIDEAKVRARKSVKHGKTYEYWFKTAPGGSERKWLSKGGFLTEKEAKEIMIAFHIAFMYNKILLT